MGTQKYPLVSVIIPCYNGEAYVTIAIESVFSTGYSNLEVIVVDDGSTDKTKEILDEYISTKKLFNVFSCCHPDGKNHGAALSRNLGISKSKGDYMCFLDHDDVYFPNRLHNAIEVLEKEEGLDACFEPYCYILDGISRFSGIDVGWRSIKPEDINNGIPDIDFPLTSNPFDDFLNGRCHVHVGTITIRRSVVEEVGGFPDIFLEDKAFLLKLMSRNRVRQVGIKAVEGYRIHGDSFCSKHEEDPKIFISPLKVLLHVLKWMRENNACKEKILLVEEAIRGKIYFYYTKIKEKGALFIRPLLKVVLEVVIEKPSFLFSIKFLRILVGLFVLSI